MLFFSSLGAQGKKKIFFKRGKLTKQSLAFLKGNLGYR